MLASTRTLLSQDVLPTSLVFAVVVWLLVRYVRAWRPGDRVVDAVPGLRARLRLLATTVAGGYLVFVVLTAGISALAGESGDYIADSLAGGAILAFGIVAPLFVGAILLEERLRRRGTARRSGPA